MSDGPRFCERCGAPLKEGAVFCGRCGQPVTAPLAPVQPVSYYRPAPAQTGGGPSPYLLLGGAAVALLFIVVLAAILFLVLRQSGRDGPLPTQVADQPATPIALSLTSTPEPPLTPATGSTPTPVPDTPIPTLAPATVAAPVQVTLTSTPVPAPPTIPAPPLVIPTSAPISAPPTVDRSALVIPTPTSIVVLVIPTATSAPAPLVPTPARVVAAQYDLYVKRIDTKTPTSDFLVGRPIRFNLLIVADTFPAGGPLFPATHFRWRPGREFDWMEGVCPANTQYATCSPSVEFIYSQAGLYEVAVEVNNRHEIPETNRGNNNKTYSFQVGDQPLPPPLPPTFTPRPVARPVPGAITVFFGIGGDGRPWGYVVDKQGYEYRPEGGYLSIRGPNPQPGDRIVFQPSAPRFSLLFDCGTWPQGYSPCDFSADSPGRLPSEVRVNQSNSLATLNISGPDNWAGTRRGFEPQRYPADPVLRISLGSSW